MPNITSDPELLHHVKGHDPTLHLKLIERATDSSRGMPDELAIFDYIYGVLHCPAYRETYKQFLKSDFPCIPWPASSSEFWDISDKGAALRRLHLMEPEAVGSMPYSLKGIGDTVVREPRFALGKIWINESQYFENVPEAVWGVEVGGYQPAQKWLKDRTGRPMEYDEIRQYQRVIKILSETDTIAKSIKITFR